MSEVPQQPFVEVTLAFRSNALRDEAEAVCQTKTGMSLRRHLKLYIREMVRGARVNAAIAAARAGTESAPDLNE